MYKLVKRTQAKLVSELTRDLNNDFRNTIFLAGTGRSGTTWLSNIINYKNEYRYMFEPFQSKKVNICAHFNYIQYLRPENKEMKYLEPAGKILSGQIKNPWIDAHNKKLWANKRLIKDIRANLLLKWIKVNFPSIPIILLLRHPCAVANSRLKLNWGSHLEEFSVQEDLLEDHLNPFKKEFEKARSDFEKHIVLWCVENYVPLRQFSVGEIHLAFYENYCISPENEVARLFSFLKKNIDDTIFTKLGSPSKVTRKESAIKTGESLVNGWRKHVMTHQVSAAVDILRIFGLDKIYSKESMPNMQNAYGFLEDNAQAYTKNLHGENSTTFPSI